MQDNGSLDFLALNRATRCVGWGGQRESKEQTRARALRSPCHGRPSTRQTAAGAEVREAHRGNLQSQDHDVVVGTNSSEVARKVSTMTSKDSLQEAGESGARTQWKKDQSKIVDILMVTVPARRL